MLILIYIDKKKILVSCINKRLTSELTKKLNLLKPVANIFLKKISGLVLWLFNSFIYICIYTFTNKN